MKTRKKLLIALLSATCITAGAFGLAACKDKTSDVDQRIMAAYELYAEAAGDGAMTYEEWLASIKGQQGEPGKDGANGTNGKDGEDGKDGVDGSTWLFGEVAPAATAGKTGDFYLDTKTFDIYLKSATGWEKKGNIKGADGEDGADGENGAPGTPGDPGTPGAPGIDGVGIANIRLIGNVLKIFFTDPAKAPVELELPEEIFHKHNYGEPVVFVPATLKKEGISYYVCSEDGHVEFFTTPKVGTKNNPITLETTGEIKLSVNDYEQYDTVYFKYNVKKDGYIYVSTPYVITYQYVDENDPSKNYVRTEKSTRAEVYKDAEFEEAVYDSTDGAGHDFSEEAYFNAGDYVYISVNCNNSNKLEVAESETASYLFNVKEFNKDGSYEHTVYIYDEGADIWDDDDNTPIAGATVKLYTRNAAGEYIELENTSATTDTNGNATFNLPLGKYYFSVNLGETSDYAPSGISTSSGEFFEFDLQLKAERALEKYVQHTVTVQYTENGETKKAEGVIVILGSSNYGINEETEKGRGTTGADGSVNIKALPNNSYYIYLENLPAGYVYAGGVRVFKSDANKPTIITLTTAPNEITLIGNTTTHEVVDGSTYMFKIEAGKTYSLSLGDETCYLMSVKIDSYGVVSDSGKGDRYTSYLSDYKFNADNCIKSITFDNNDFESEYVTFKVSAANTITITVVENAE